jgi:4-hydroxybenzoate polyprenyltransferase
MAGPTLPRRLASLVRLEHSLFALPYAYVGALLAADGLPAVATLVWITVAMVGARSLAMALNRLIDAEIDARNPRTARRELPAGLLGRRQVEAFCLASLAVFLLAVSQLAPLTWLLWPLVVVPFVVYPYLKRVTPLCHVWLGLCLGLAPVGAAVAVTDRVEPAFFLLLGVVATWVAGFDVIYATMDLDHDRREGLHSIPADFGVSTALLVARGLHGTSVALMAGVGLAFDLGAAYWIGVVVCGALLAYENALVRPHDLSRVNAAFFNVNAIVAGLYLLAVSVDLASG